MSLFMRFARTVTVVLVVAWSGFLVVEPRVAAQDATPDAGTTYTSQQFGYQMSWSAPWILTGSDSGEGYDTVTLTDGEVMATIVFSRPGDTDLSEIVHLLVAGPDDDPFVAGTPATDAAGSVIQGDSPDRAWGAWLGGASAEDATDFRYGEVRRLSGDLAVGLVVAMPAGAFDGTIERFSALLDTMAPVADGVAASQRAQIVLDPGIPLADQQLISEAVRLAEDFFAARFGVPPSGSVTVTALPQMGPNGDSLIAATLGDQIVVYTESAGWVGSPPAERIRTIVHEYTHTYQFAKTYDSPAESPAWFEEGVAEYLSMVALDDLGLVDRADLEGYFGIAVLHTDLPALPALERYGAMQAQPGEVYPLSYLAVNFLMQQLPLSAIDDYYTALQQGQPFAAAFEQAFGITPEAFYDAFAQYRATSLPTNDAYPVELEVTAGADQPSAVVIEEHPSVVLPGEQALIVAQALPGSNCTLDLTNGAVPVLTDQETFTSGDGQVFWLLTVPEDTPSGSGTFTLACGADPLSVPVLIG